MEHHGFYKWALPLEKDLFEKLAQSAHFEAVGKGRQGNHLVNPNEAGIPIVRTTTQYHIPANHFAAIHHKIAEAIQQEAQNAWGRQGNTLHFNNALIEIYDHSYMKMKYHSDQALDLVENSYIALFSCYAKPEKLNKNSWRKLKIQNKTTEEEFEFILENNTVIVFSLPTNTAFSHKIVLETSQPDADNEWLGITFRQSKTFIHFRENLPYFVDGTPLKMADETESKAFYKLRGQENYIRPLPTH